MKHELVERLALESDEEPPCEPPLYDGKGKLPKSTKEIGRRSKRYLRSILPSHGLAACGTRDELILQVGLIANNMEHLCLDRERKMFLDLIRITKDLMLAERKQSLVQDVPTYKHRTYGTPMEPSLSSDRPRYHAAAQTQHSVKACVAIPEGITIANLHEMFDEMVQHVDRKKAEVFSSGDREFITSAQELDCDDMRAAILQKGSKVCMRTEMTYHCLYCHGIE